MSQQEHPIHWHPVNDPQLVASQAAQRILEAASRAIAERGRFRIVLAGGRTPAAAYRLLVGADTDWSHWEIYFGDERCLPKDDAQRNSRMAAGAFLDSVPVPAANIHPIAAELGAEDAARRYEPIVRTALPFDLVLLGIGEDGHTASLFPGQRHPADRLVLPVHNAPKPPPERISLSAGALSAARQILVLVTGADKRAALHAWRTGEPLPIAEIGGSVPVDVLTDIAEEFC